MTLHRTFSNRKFKIDALTTYLNTGTKHAIVIGLMTGVFQKFPSSSLYVSSNLKYLDMKNNPGSGSGKMELFFLACGLLFTKLGNLAKPTLMPAELRIVNQIHFLYPLIEGGI